MFKRLKYRGYLQYVLPTLFTCMLTGQVYVQEQPTTLLRQKLAPGLEKAAAHATHFSVRVQVKDKAAFLVWLKAQQIDAGVSVTEREDLITLSKVNAHTLQKLIQHPGITYIDRTDRVAREELELRDADFTVNKVYSLQSKYPALTGEGFAVSVKESAFDPEDLDLKGRTLEPKNNVSVYSIHATTMATLIAGAGNSGPDGKGVAPQAKLAYSNFANLLPDNSSTLLASGISVQNHSYGVGVENYYGIESAAYDKETFEHPQLLHIFSSGNSGDKSAETGSYANLVGMANLTGQFKTSKNTLSVGALDPDGSIGRLSSKGPAYDGRVKPELVAHGIGGTSEAAAVVSGIALLVQQAYALQYGGTLPPAALVKAALINSAEDVGRPAVDFESGYGNTDALGAVRTIRQNNFFTGSVTQGQRQRFIVTVPEGARQLKVTLVWHEAAASPSAQVALINDLDLTLRNTVTGEVWHPWVLSKYPHADSLKLPAKRGIDRINNIEQVTIASPAAGNYELLINGFTVPQGAQEFSLVYESKNTSEWIYPAASSALVVSKPYTISWQVNKTGESARLEYRNVNDNDWKLIQENAGINSNSFTWQTPDEVGIFQLRLVTDAGILASEEFVVSKLLKLKVGFNCDDQVMVHWSAMPGAQHYQLLQMGATRLEHLVTTPDTFAILSKSDFQGLSNLLAVTPVIQNKQGYSSSTIATDQTGVECYIKRFLPNQLVLKQVDLQLEISTLFELASLTLERQTTNGFAPIQTITPTQLIYSLSDPAPTPGKNTYRVKLVTESGKVYYSHSEEIIYAPENYVQVYPNPLAAGEPISVVVASASAQIQLFDGVGRLIYQSTEDSAIKTIPTTSLPAGLYILRILTEEGNYLSSRLIIY